MTWRDLKYLLAYTGPALVYVGLLEKGWYSWLAVIFAFCILPAADWLSGFVSIEKRHIAGADLKTRAGHIWFDLLLYINLPIMYFLVFCYLKTVTGSHLALYVVIGLTLGLGTFLGANGINVAHELGHRKNRWERVMAILLLISAWYQHFYIEHNRGHHRYVATKEDPATARLGESFYRFWVRSTVGSLISAWRLECKRLTARGKAIISWHNQMIQFAVLQVLYSVIVLWWSGFAGLAYAVIIGILAFTLLEAINYIEHYGLLRKRLPSGKYERVGMQHSWNSEHQLGRIMLYELSLHADHHYKASKKYQTLQSIPESPQLPTGYPGSILMALIPPLWFWVVDKRIPAEMTGKIVQ